MFLRLAYKSLLDRKGSVTLTLLAISVSVFVLLGIEHIRHQAKYSFTNTVSGTDLIVGARTGSVNLLLYSVFRIGNPTNNIQWDTYQKITQNPNIDWTIPISLGDSHKGYRVVGTNSDYFQHFRYGKKKNLSFKQGKPFEDLFDVVLGADVARQLQYQLGDQIVLAHGIASTSFSMHDDLPFQIVGILESTGTPVDQALYVSLEAIEAIHIGWQQGVRIPGRTPSVSEIDERELTPKNITAFMVGLKSKIATFRVQRAINLYRGEPLLAILPGVTLSEFWRTLAVMENTLRLVSLLVLAAALLGLAGMLLASIRERQREIAIMRTLGASPWFVFFLIELEALLITLVASVIAVVMLFIALLGLSGPLATTYGLHIDTNFLSQDTLLLLLMILASSLIISCIPALAAYSKALQKELIST